MAYSLEDLRKLKERKQKKDSTVTNKYDSNKLNEIKSRISSRSNSDLGILSPRGEFNIGLDKPKPTPSITVPMPKGYTPMTTSNYIPPKEQEYKRKMGVVNKQIQEYEKQNTFKNEQLQKQKDFSVKYPELSSKYKTPELARSGLTTLRRDPRLGATGVTTPLPWETAPGAGFFGGSTLGLSDTLINKFGTPEQKEKLQFSKTLPEYKAGELAGYIAPSTGFTKLAGNVMKGTKGLRTSKGILKLMTMEGLAGLGMGTTEGIIRGEGLEGTAKRAGEYAGYGAGGAGLVGLVGKGISKLSSLRKPKFNTPDLPNTSYLPSELDEINRLNQSREFQPRIDNRATTSMQEADILSRGTLVGDTPRIIPRSLEIPQAKIKAPFPVSTIEPPTVRSFKPNKDISPMGAYKMKRAKVKAEGAKIPEYVQRIEEPNVGRATADKPHGVYTTPSNVKNPHRELGGNKFYWKTNPKANILEVDATGTFKTNRGDVAQGAGILPARQFLGDDKVARMMNTNKNELASELGSKYEGVDFNKYYDQTEMVEAVGAIEAKNRGYDAIFAKDAVDPEFNEFVGLTDNAFTPVDSVPKKKLGLGTQENLFPTKRKETKSFNIDFDDGRNSFKVVDTPDPNTGKTLGQTVDDTIPNEHIKYTRTDFGTDNTNNAVRETMEGLEGLNVGRDDVVVNNANKIRSKKTGVAYGMTDLERNLEYSLGKDSDLFKRVKKTTLDPLFKNKANYADQVTKRTDDLYNTVVKDLGIKPRTKESKAIQWYGEKKKPSGFEKIKDPDTGKVFNKQLTTPYGLEDLKNDFPNKWKDIVEADKFFRKNYDELIDNVNATRKAVYPTNPDKLVPKRQDYYRHFREQADSFKGMIDMFDTPANISPELAGISEFTTPKTKWQSFAQRRGLGKYTDDAILGYLDYIKPSAYSTHIDKSIPSFRKLTKDVIEGTMNSKNANPFIEYLTDYTNDLAGKTNKLDRWISGIVNRKALDVLNSVTGRVKGNVVLGNITSALAQPANMANAVGNIKNPKDWFKGNIGFFKNREANKALSPFLKERQLDNLFDKFDERILSKPKQFAKWMLSVGDEVGSELIWNAAHSKANRLGIDNPIQYADEITRKMIAGRGIGEVPLYQKSKLVKSIAPFQLEVANAWHVLKDRGREKDIGGILMILIANNLYNHVYESITGRRMLFDPMEAIYDAATREDAGADEVAGRLGGELLSSIPFGGEIAETLITSPYDRKKVFGKSDPTRFGTGLLAIEGIKDPLSKLLTPWGGNQIKKTLGGIDAINRGGSYSNKDEFQFPVGNDLESSLKALTLGKYSTPEAAEYFDKDSSPLSKKQTKTLQSVKDKKAYLEAIKLRRERAKERKKLIEQRKR